MKAFAFSFSVMMSAATFALAMDTKPASSGARPAWTVREWRGMPGLWKDDQPVTPMIFWQWKPETYEVEHFSSAGINLFSFFGSFQHYDHPYWLPDGSVAPEFQETEISKLLRLGSVDIVSAPHTYYRRALGGDGEMRQYLTSAALHGKLFIDEGDDQTYLEKRKPKPDRRCHVNTVEETQSLLYREFGNTVTHGVGLWYMDLNGGWFRDPVLIDTIGRMKKWADVAMDHSRRRNAQVAVISAPESEFYLGYRQTPDNEISYGLYHDQMAEFYRTGAPFDWYLIDDLDAIRDRGYKVFVFLDCFYLTDPQRKAAEALRSDGRTLIWFYAPGYASQENLSLARMEALTGFGFDPAEEGMLQGVLTASGKTVGIAKRQKSLFTVRPGEGVLELARGTACLKEKTVMALKAHPGWTSVFSAIPGVTADQLRELYRQAGVHVYTDCGDVLSANESWLMLHTRTSGRKQIVLPRTCRKVTEITTEREIGKDIRALTIALPQYSTAVFLME